MSNIKVPILGAGMGVGAIYNQADGSVTYVDVNRYEVGAGLSLGSYQVLAIFDSESTLNEYREGVWEPSLGVEWNLGEDGAYSSMSLAGRDEDVPIFLLSHSGGGAVGSARLVSVSVNYDLTETGLGEVRVAISVLDLVDRQNRPALLLTVFSFLTVIFFGVSDF